MLGNTMLACRRAQGTARPDPPGAFCDATVLVSGGSQPQNPVALAVARAARVRVQGRSSLEGSNGVGIWNILKGCCRVFRVRVNANSSDTKYVVSCNRSFESNVQD